MGIRIGWQENEQLKQRKNLEQRDELKWRKDELVKFISEYGDRCNMPFCNDLINKDDPKLLSWGIESYEPGIYIESLDISSFGICDNCHLMLSKIYNIMKGSRK